MALAVTTTDAYLVMGQPEFSGLATAPRQKQIFTNQVTF